MILIIHFSSKNNQFESVNVIKLSINHYAVNNENTVIKVNESYELHYNYSTPAFHMTPKCTMPQNP